MVTAALLIAAVGTACVGGAVFAFSLFVMPALNRLSPAESIRAMQSINLRAERAPFGLVILAPFFAAVGLAIAAVVSPSPASPFVLTGAALYVLVGLGVTGAVNVPLNNRLARVGQQQPGRQQRSRQFGQQQPSQQEPSQQQPGQQQPGDLDASTWAAFERPWVRANHVRSAGALLASACFTAAALLAR